MLLIIFFEKKVSCTGPGGASGLQIIDRGGIEGVGNATVCRQECSSY